MKRLFIVFVLIWMFFFACKKEKRYRINTELVKIDSLSQVVAVTDSLVRPVIYDDVDELLSAPSAETKTLFISIVLPSILIAKHQMEQKKSYVLQLTKKKSWESEDSLTYTSLLNQYKARSTDDLIQRLQPVPTSVVIAQAIVETGWGRSRFFLEGRNMFGIWSAKSNASKLIAMKRRNGNPVYVRAYENIAVSAADYYETIARSSAYRSLRSALQSTNDPFEILPHLKYYSEQRRTYTEKLAKIIRQNDLTRFDHYRIDPEFFQEE